MWKLREGIKMDIRRVLVLLLLGITGIWDKREKAIPIWLVMFFISLGIAVNIWSPYFTMGEVLLGGTLGLFLLFISQITSGEIGSGDGYIMMAVGIYLGIWNSLNLLFWGLLFAAIISLCLIKIKKKNWKTTIPFIPFLLCAYVFGLLMEF
jgi:Type IV leader peptidase family.